MLVLHFFFVGCTSPIWIAFWCFKDGTSPSVPVGVVYGISFTDHIITENIIRELGGVFVEPLQPNLGSSAKSITGIIEVCFAIILFNSQYLAVPFAWFDVVLLTHHIPINGFEIDILLERRLSICTADLSFHRLCFITGEFQQQYCAYVE